MNLAAGGDDDVGPFLGIRESDTGTDVSSATKDDACRANELTMWPCDGIVLSVSVKICL